MEEKEIFEKTPAERMDAFLAEYKALLESSENGWLFQYYPQKDQNYGGYNYILKFKDGYVTAWLELADKEETSTFKMTPDDGPVISFDTYNANLHYFAEASGAQYQGLQGDYEYNILGKSEDGSEIYVKGRKSGNVLTMKKFEGTDPVAYFTECSAVYEGMTAPSYALSVEGVSSSCSMAGNVFAYSYTVGEGEAAETVEGEVAYCFTPSGVAFYEPVELAGQSYEGLAYNAENSTLVSEDGKIVISLVFPPINQMMVAGGWFITYDQLGGAIKTAFNTAYNNIKLRGYPIQYIFFGPYLWGDFALEHIIGGYYGSCGLDYELIGEDKVQFTYNAKNQSNGDTFYSWGLNKAVSAITGKTFTITTDSQKKPSYLLLTDDADSANTMKLVSSEVMYK